MCVPIKGQEHCSVWLRQISARNSAIAKKSRVSCSHNVTTTRRALGRVHLPPTTVFLRLKTTRRCCDGRQITMPNTCAWDFPDVIKFRVAVHTILEKKTFRLRYPNYDPDRVQKLISSSVSRHLSRRKMSPKSMDAFLSNLANRQTDRRTDKHRGKSHLLPPLSEVNKVMRSMTYLPRRYRQTDRQLQLQLTGSLFFSYFAISVTVTVTVTVNCYNTAATPTS